MPRALKQRNSNKIEKIARNASQGKLKITSFLNSLPLYSQNAFFKACTHPFAAEAINDFIQQLESYEFVAFYDPFNNAPAFGSIHNLSKVKISNIYVQQVADIGKNVLDIVTKPIDQIHSENPAVLVVFAFDAAIQISNIRHLLPEDCVILTLDNIKIPEQYLTRPDNYLNQLNFATNFGFLRDEAGLHTRISIGNYWGSYGAKDVQMCCWLFDANGRQIASWQQSMGNAGELLTIDSQEVKARFNLPDFTGSLFMHATKITGHDIVKYVCDVFDTEGKIHSVTHDSNSWPADYYSGILAPQNGEKILLWIQNCYPVTIQAGSIGLRLIGTDEDVYLEQEIAPFATYAWDLGAALPASFPAQYEIIANKYFTRPRFEVLQANGCRYISHANVERVDLIPDKDLPVIYKHLGKGYILPFPIMPTEKFDTIIVPTPMATTQQSLPLHLYVYNTDGQLVSEKTLPPIARSEGVVINVQDLAGKEFKGGHVEIGYDAANIAQADGWLHALIRCTDRQTGQAAETSFGAHIYNMPIVYKNEPQSYKGNPPGLRTTLVLRTAGGEDTFCNLIYPCSKEWLAHSSTDLILFNEKGLEIAKTHIKIPMHGSILWTYKEIFTQAQRNQAGQNSYIVIKDTSCRLFGFHGQLNKNNVFSLDHMFGY
jgi:hypothetical protein